MPQGAKLVNPFAAPDLAADVFYPAGVALLVVLTGITAVAALSNVWQASPVPMTSGGKFTSRVPGLPALERAAQASASAPPPMLTQPVPQAAIVTAAKTGRWGAAIAAAPVVRIGKATLKISNRHVAAPVSTEPLPVVATATPMTEKPGDGLVTTVLSPFRSLWTMTASAGGALMSHILPQ